MIPHWRPSLMFYLLSPTICQWLKGHFFNFELLIFYPCINKLKSLKVAQVKDEMDDDEDDGCDVVCDVVWWCCVMMLCDDVVMWCCVWYCVVMLCCDVVFWCCVVMLCFDVVFWCCVVMFVLWCCVWDVVCDGVIGGECCGKVKWMILCCFGVLLTDWLTDWRTDERTNGHWWF